MMIREVAILLLSLFVLEEATVMKKESLSKEVIADITNIKLRKDAFDERMTGSLQFSECLESADIELVSTEDNRLTGRMEFNVQNGMCCIDRRTHTAKLCHNGAEHRITVFEGENATLTCQPIEGSTEPFNWTRQDGSTVQDRRFLTQGANNNELHISNASIDDTGVYLCQVSTPQGLQIGRWRLQVDETPRLSPTTASPMPPQVLCEGNYQLGETAFQIRQQSISPAADIVIVVDESYSMDGEHKWLPQMVKNLDKKLKEKNIGNDLNRPNHFALVGFGLEDPVNGIAPFCPHQYNTSDKKPVFLSSEFEHVAAQLRASGEVEDGYLAMSYGINNITWPNGTQALRKNVVGIAQNMILITDEDRDILNNTGRELDRSGIKRMLRRNNVVLNVVIDQKFFYGRNRRRAIGVDYNRNGYTLTEGRNYSLITENITHGKGYQVTRRHYTNLAIDAQIFGAAWDINILRNINRTISESFTEAFVNVKTNEIIRQVNECLKCTCQGNGARGALQCQRAQDQAECCNHVGGQFTEDTCKT